MEILPIAVKFVSWDVSPLDTLKNSRAYMLREKLNGNGKMDRTEKNWLAENIKNNSYFRTSIPLMGYRFDFADVLCVYRRNNMICCKDGLNKWNGLCLIVTKRIKHPHFEAIYIIFLYSLIVKCDVTFLRFYKIKRKTGAECYLGNL